MAVRAIWAKRKIFRFLVAVGVATIVTTLTGCGGGSNAIPATGTASGTLAATLRIDVPAPASVSSVRRPKYISASTRSIAMTFTPVAAGASVSINQNLTPATNTNCVATTAAATAFVCTIAFQIATGSYIARIGLFDGALNAHGKPSGNELSSGQSVAVTFGAGRSNIVALTLDGIPRSVLVTSAAQAVHIAANSDIAVYGSAAQTIQINAFDADGNTIAGPGAPKFALAVTGGGFTTTATAGSTNTFTLTPPAAPVTGTVTNAVLSVTASTLSNGCAQTGNACKKTVALSNHVQKLFVSTHPGGSDFLALSAFSAPYIATTPTPLTLLGPAAVTALAANAAGTCVAASVPFAGAVPALPNQLLLDPSPYTAQQAFVNLTGVANAAAFDAAGNLFVGQPASVVEYTAASVSSSTAPATPAVSVPAANPVAIALDAAADLFILNGTGTLTKSTLPYSATPAVVSTTITSPVSLAFDAKGNLFVASSTAVTIYASPYTGTPEATVPITGSPAGFAVDPLGDVFIAQATAGAPIQEYAPPWTAAPIAIALASAADTPQSLATDGVGNLFVVTAQPPATGTFSVLEYAPPFSAGPTTLTASTALPLVTLTP